jgi:DNA-binding NarL/FixJ family response regulator
MTRKTLRLLIADDHEIFREGLTALLELEPDIEVIGAVGRADEVKAAVTSTHCDILLLDLKLDRWVTEDISELAKLTKIVVLSGTDRADELVAAFNSGARAIVQKTVAAETVIQAIRAVASGMVWMPPALRRKLTASKPQSAASDQLTVREREVVRQVAVGLRNAEVAEKLAISEGTVKIHLNNIFSKLNIRDRVELTLYALRSGLINLP